jgi:hypothetical protein
VYHSLPHSTPKKASHVPKMTIQTTTRRRKPTIAKLRGEQNTP